MKQLQPLTALRFLAVTAIFLHHSDYLFANNKPFMEIYHRLFREGYIGVTFFFVLSGFIITYNYFDKCLLNNDWVKTFYLNRLSRIYPVHLLTLVLAIPLTSFNLWNLLLLQSFIPDRAVYFSGNLVTWGLSDLAFFYFLFPFLILIIKKTTVPIRTATLIWTALTFLTYWLRDNTLSHWLFYIFPGTRLIDFSIGILLGIAYKRLVPFLSGRIYTVLELLSLFTLGVAVVISPAIHQTLRYDVYYLPFMALIIIVFAVGSGWLSRLMSIKPMLFLGKLSFAFFLVHQLVIRYMQGLIITTGLSLASCFAILFTAFVISLGLSWFIFERFEVPIRNRLRAH